MTELYWWGFGIALFCYAGYLAPEEDLPYRVLLCAFTALLWPISLAWWLLTRWLARRAAA